MSNIIEFVQDQVQLFEGANSSQSVEWGKESQFAIQLFQANDYLANTALQNPVSAQNAIINVAAIGITLNPSQKLAYLVPRRVNKKQAVCLDISYMGLLHIAMETGSIRWGQVVLVYSNDNFKLKGLGVMPEHEFNPFGDRGDLVGVYCTVKTSDGDYLTETMKIDDVYAIRARSEAYKKGHGPWTTDNDEMVRKTVIKRAYKYWPKVERLSNAIEMLNNEGEGIETEPVMKHTSQQEKEVNAKEDHSALKEKLDDLAFKMDNSQNLEELKGAFGQAWMITKDHKDLQQQAQKIYVENQKRLDGAK